MKINEKAKALLNDDIVEFEYIIPVTVVSTESYSQPINVQYLTHSESIPSEVITKIQLESHQTPPVSIYNAGDYYLVRIKSD